VGQLRVRGGLRGASIGLETAPDRVATGRWRTSPRHRCDEASIHPGGPTTLEGFRLSGGNRRSGTGRSRSLNETEIAAVITGIMMMPMMSGVAHDQGPSCAPQSEVKIGIVTNFIHRRTQKKSAMTAGAREFLGKPFTVKVAGDACQRFAAIAGRWRFRRVVPPPPLAFFQPFLLPTRPRHRIVKRYMDRCPAHPFHNFSPGFQPWESSYGAATRPEGRRQIQYPWPGGSGGSNGQFQRIKLRAAASALAS